MAMAYATGHLSGAHLNPAVTLTFVPLRHLPRGGALAYLPAPLAGAIIGALAHQLVRGEHPDGPPPQGRAA
jgi:aquaporin NIP